MRGEVTVPRIAAQLRAEGVDRIAIVSDDSKTYSRNADIPRGVTFHDRWRLDAVQRELRDTKGVSALVYDQPCTAEVRRLRRRGAYPDPAKRVVINETLCEGCGDCNVQSNCISVEPVETEFGRKRRINQSSCNKDYSCVQGYCPSFVTVLGGRAFATKPGPSPEAALADVPEPGVAAVAGIHSTLIAGIGGGGVVTAGALLGVAAHIEGKGVSVLDLTGLAQKNGPVTSHVRIWEDPDAVHASRIPSGSADTIVGSDLVVAADAESLDKVRRDHTRLVVNSHVAPTAQFALSPDLDLSAEPMIRALRRAAPEGALLVDATRLVEERFGDIVFVNPFLLGICCQRGLLPVSGTSITRAMELNGRAVAENIRAFEWGRVYAHDPRLFGLDDPQRGTTPPGTLRDSLDPLVDRFADFLEEYQDAAYAERFRRFVGEVAKVEAPLSSSPRLALSVARSYFKLLAYKDEYEVARLLTFPPSSRPGSNGSLQPATASNSI